MTITIHSTDKIVQINDLPARVWEGASESGVRVVCFITRVMIDEDEPRREEFERELQEQQPPSEVAQAIPLRMII